MNINYRRKQIFLLRFSGWFCLLPATAFLYLYQNMHITFMLVELIITVLFAAYLLATAKSERWTKPKNVLGLLVFALIFIAMIEAIPLLFAYLNCRKIK